MCENYNPPDFDVPVSERHHSQNMRRIAVRRMQRENAVTGANKRHLPLKRSECEQEIRPCPYVTCKYHLALDAQENRVTFNFPGKNLEDMKQTCTLDVAAEGPHSLETVAGYLNLTRERIRQIEAKIFKKLLALDDLTGCLTELL